jgi:hypothetical protein
MMNVTPMIGLNAGMLIQQRDSLNQGDQLLEIPSHPNFGDGHLGGEDPCKWHHHRLGTLGGGPSLKVTEWLKNLGRKRVLLARRYRSFCGQYAPSLFGRIGEMNREHPGPELKFQVADAGCDHAGRALL